MKVLSLDSPLKGPLHLSAESVSQLAWVSAMIFPDLGQKSWRICYRNSSIASLRGWVACGPAWLERPHSIAQSWTRGLLLKVNGYWGFVSRSQLLLV